jgi:hypothetical protein
MRFSTEASSMRQIGYYGGRNHALQRTAASRRVCNPGALWPPSLSFIR